MVFCTPRPVASVYLISRYETSIWLSLNIKCMCIAWTADVITEEHIVGDLMHHTWTLESSHCQWWNLYASLAWILANFN